MKTLFWKMICFTFTDVRLRTYGKMAAVTQYAKGRDSQRQLLQMQTQDSVAA
jgi:hypothetical protein